MPSISVSSLILQITLSPDPTFLPHCPAAHCPNQNQGALRSFPSTGTPPLPPPHFLMTCLVVSSQIDLQAYDRGGILLSLLTAVYLQRLPWWETHRRHHQFLLMKKRPDEAVTRSRIRLALEIHVSATNKKLRASGKACLECQCIHTSRVTGPVLRHYF